MHGLSSPRKLLAYEEIADCSVRLFVGQVMGGFNPHQPPPEYATAAVSKAGRHMHMQRTQDRSGGRGEGFATLLHG